MKSLKHIYAKDQELAEIRKIFHFQRVEDRLEDWCEAYIPISKEHKAEYYKRNIELWDKMWAFYMIPTPEQIMAIFDDIYKKYYQEI